MENYEGYYNEINVIIDELDKHRTVLFAAVCNNYPESWKSQYDSDGSYEDGWFIAGINTVQGQITYRQKIKYWDIFKCPIVEKAPEYDGHTSDDMIELFIDLDLPKVK